MGRTVAGKVAARLIEAGLAASTPVAVIENASRPDRRAYAGRLDELAELARRPELTGPVIIIIGEVVAAGAIAGRNAAGARRARAEAIGQDEAMFKAAKVRTPEGDHRQPAR